MLNYQKGLLAILIGLSLGIGGTLPKAIGQEEADCFMVDAQGNTISLGSLCGSGTAPAGVPRSRSVSPGASPTGSPTPRGTAPATLANQCQQLQGTIDRQFRALRNFQPQPGADGLGLSGLLSLIQTSSQELQALPLQDRNLQQWRSRLVQQYQQGSQMLQAFWGEGGLEQLMMQLVASFGSAMVEMVDGMARSFGAEVSPQMRQEMTRQLDPSQGQWEIRTSTPAAGHDGPDPETQAILDQINAYCRR
ncbi:hypothetical protein OOK60_03945 [Trichothermofontia sichuanensis B231]|uniref:hypothetical protein n=1 Tax=Trichothermofontia sichuanensis TaxID=3045816 RepID=UPI002247F097|nr:hypothetical protein [Trichothermofontia sichuanensis]UZQ55238.1 hypothetical protein OOK60_03945 [Trichothermofontia sichuanensis B231]